MSLIKTLREPKVAGMAIFDLLGTAAVAYAMSNYLDRGFILVFIILLCLGIAVHYAIGTPTMLNFYLGLNSLEDVLKAREA